MEVTSTGYTSYDALEKFATVMASTQTLKAFAKYLSTTKKQRWFCYEYISTGRPVKDENVVLLKQVRRIIILMKQLKIEVTPHMLLVVLHLSEISVTGEMPKNSGIVPELYIAQNARAMAIMNQKIMNRFSLNLECLWDYWLVELLNGTYLGTVSGNKIPKIFLGKNKKFAGRKLMEIDGNTAPLEKIIIRDRKVPYELTSFIQDLWQQFPELRDNMLEFGY